MFTAILPAGRTVAWFALEQDEHRVVGASGLIDLGPIKLAGQIDWPAVYRRRSPRAGASSRSIAR